MLSSNPDNQRYSSAMMEVLRAVKNDKFGKEDRGAGHYPRGNGENTTLETLVETGHDRVLDLILTSTDSYSPNKELANIYWEAKQYDKIFDLLDRFPNRHFGFRRGDLCKLLSSEKADDELIKKSLSYFDEDEELKVGTVVQKLIEDGRYDLAQEIVDEHFKEDQKPLVPVIIEARKGRLPDNEKISELFELVCPLNSKEDNSDELDEFDLRRRREKCFLWLIEELSECDLALDSAKLIVTEFHARKERELVFAYSSSTDSLHKKIENDFIARKAYDEGIEFFKSIDGWACRSINYEKNNHIRFNGTQEEHKAVLESLEASKNEQAKEIMERYKFESEDQIESLTGGDWDHQKRIDYFEGQARFFADKAIYELKWGSKESAQPYIDEMMSFVEKIGISPKEDCPISHQKYLSRTRKRFKRSLRLKFREFGFLQDLPRMGNWNTEITADEEEIAERRSVNRKKKKELHEKENEARIIEMEEYRKKQYHDRINSVKEALEKGVDEAIEVLKKGDAYSEPMPEDWQSALLILEADPSRFDDIVEIVSKKLFDTRSYYQGDTRWDHRDLVQFYFEGEKLGVVNDEKWYELFKKWDKAAYIPDVGFIPLPYEGILTMIDTLLERGDWERALKYFQHLNENTNLARNIIMDCLAKFVQLSMKETPEEFTGASCIFNGKELPENASRADQIEYWNTKCEWALSSNDTEAFELANQKLLELLNNHDEIRFWTKLMGDFSFRDHHQKKNTLMEIYSREGQSEQVRRRIVSALIDNSVPGAETMAEIKSKETPFKLTRFFFEKLTASGILHIYTTAFLNEQDMPYLRRILSEHQNQFNTVMEVLDANSDDGPMTPQRWKGVLSVLRQVGVLTPGIYAQAKACNFNEAKLSKLAEKVAQVKKRMFSNEALDDSFSPALLAEMIWIAYEPVNMSLSEVERLLFRIHDCTEHLSDFTFPKDGYELDITTAKEVCLRNGAKISVSKHLYNPPRLKKMKAEEKIQLRQEQVKKLCDLGRFKVDSVDMNDVLVAFSGDAFMMQALKDWGLAHSEDEQFKSLRKLQEGLGIYMSDNAERIIKEFLTRHSEHTSNMIEGLVKGLKKKGKKMAVKNQLGVEIDENASDIDIAAKIISQVILKKFKPLQVLRKEIKADTKKFVSKEDGEDLILSDSSLRAVISKNKASFFAKSSAGICTARNTELFHRENHFHINLIDKGENCVGNVQAYIMPHNGENYLLLRGINPSTKFLETIDIESLCESIIAVGKQFASDNNLAGLMLSENLGAWHALSNRPGVVSYIENTYSKQSVDIDSFSIGGGAGDLEKAYLIDRRRKATKNGRAFNGSEEYPYSEAI